MQMLIKIVISNRISFGENGFKYFIGLKDAEKVNPLCIQNSVDIQSKVSIISIDSVFKIGKRCYPQVLRRI